MAAFDDSQFTFAEGGQMPKNNDGVWPVFMLLAEENPRESAKAGRPIFVEKELVEIHIVGDKNTVASTYVTDAIRQRWPREYQAFKQRREMATTGTPLEKWPPLTAGMVAEFKAINIRTVEELAAIDDRTIQRIGLGGRKYAEMAKAYLAASKDTAVITKMQADKEQAESEIADLRRQLKEMKAELKASSEPDPERRGPGRPRKEV